MGLLLLYRVPESTKVLKLLIVDVLYRVPKVNTAYPEQVYVAVL
jgi:hypothetical protein